MKEVDKWIEDKEREKAENGAHDGLCIKRSGKIKQGVNSYLHSPVNHTQTCALICG